METTTPKVRQLLAALVVLLITAAGASLHGSAAAQPVATADGEAEGRTMLLLDSSGSMAEAAGGGKTKIEAAKSALRTVVEGLPDDAEVGLRVFGAKVYSRTDAGSCEDSQVVVKPGTDNRDALLGEIDTYKPYGETPIPHALREAAKDLGSEGVRSIVLVSDGESTCDPDPCKVAEDLAEDGIDLRIDVVGLSVSGKARNQLKCIAESGNGDYFDADDAGDIEATLTRVAKRAVQPFSLGGEPIEGGTESDPTPVTIGNWIDTIDSGEEKFYAFDRTEAGSTLRLAALTQGEFEGSNDSILIEVLDPDGERCDRNGQNRYANTRTLTGVQATAGEAEECDRAGLHVIKVSRRSMKGGSAPVALRVTEEPPVTDPGFAGADVPAAELAFQGTAEQVAGSASFEGAPQLTSGLWASDIVPGEALVYKFRLEYGQHATAGVRFPAGNAAQRRAFKYPPLASVSLHNPLMAMLGSPQDAENFNKLTVGDDAPANFLVATSQVSKVTGRDRGSVGGGADYTVAGDYYLMVAVERDEELIELPFEIDLQIEGEPAAGPTYVDGASWTIADGGQGGTAADTESDEGSDDSAAADESSAVSLRTALGVGVGVLAVGVLAAALLLRRRRNTV